MNLLQPELKILPILVFSNYTQNVGDKIFAIDRSGIK